MDPVLTLSCYFNNKAKLSPWMAAGKAVLAEESIPHVLRPFTRRTLPRKGLCRAWSRCQPRPFPTGRAVHDDKGTSAP